MVQAVETVLPRSGRPVADRARAQQDRPGRRRDARGLENRFPGSLQVSAQTGEGARRTSRSRCAALRGPVPGRGAAGAVRAGDVVSSLRARTADRAPRGSRRRSSSAHGCPSGLRRLAPFLVRDAVALRDRAPRHRLRDDASLPRAPTRATPASISLPASASCSARALRRANGHRGSHPEGYAGLVIPRSGLASSTASRSSILPG